MKKLDFFGIGPKIAIVMLPWLAVSIILSIVLKNTFAFTTDNKKIILLTGILLMLFGLIFYFSTVRVLLKGLRETKLQTKGAFSLCRNPLYSSIALFIIPALSLILNSWLVLTTSIVGYIMFKVHIKDECRELEKFFGAEYLKYKSETPEFFPFPVKKWLRK
jgi:protein-S-isoprenylcysteine O-methyltransferase Ste14